MPKDDLDSSDPFSGIRGCMHLGELVGTVIGIAGGAYLTHKLGESYTLDALIGAPVGGVVGYEVGKVTGLVFHNPIIYFFDLLIKGILYPPFYLYVKGEDLVSYIKNRYYKRSSKTFERKTKR